MRNIKDTVRIGFSLVELVVVMAILATLAALAVGAYSRVRAGQSEKNTEITLSRINALLDLRYSQILDDSREKFNRKLTSTEKDQIKLYADNDEQRALVVFLYATLTVNFPTSRTEAITPINLGGYIVRPVTSLGNIKTGSSPEEESAACLYAILSQINETGSSFDQQTTTLTAGPVIVDGWSHPIAFTRLTYCAELNGPPYSNSSGRYPSKDPLDPYAKLVGWSNVTDFWGKVAGNHLRYSQFPVTYPGAASNWVMSAVSPGPRGLWGDLTATTPTNVYDIYNNEPSLVDPPQVNASAPDELEELDNLFSFRLRASTKAGN